ncbi:MAG: hypothetical protein JWQ54_1730 [Mucilaginibacter sp.]|nr:hypothetical protein [Mucilaginibacter sp.]
MRSIVIETIRNDTRANLVTEDDMELLFKKSQEEEVAVGVAAGVAVAAEEEVVPAPDEEEYDYDYEDDPEETTPGDYEYEYDNTGAFIIRSGTDWQLQDDDEPEAGMLLGKLWMQDELCILFADTNVGKSILAVQIADSISRGLPIPGFELTLPAAPVVYFDFELSDQQFRRRYSSAADGKHPFNGNFFRATLNPFSSKQNRFNTYEEFINNEIENALLACKAKVLIIDNITCLRYGTQSAAGALNLMEYLQNIKRRYRISILVLAHTPKRNTTKPLSRNDLQGSKMLINLADSAFAIGESQQTAGLRYLKQIKQRSISEEYGAANICFGAIVKTGPFLHFQFSGQGYESDHLATYNEQYRKNTETRIAQLNKQCLTIRQIAAQLGLASTTVFRIIKRLGDAGECADVGGCADFGCANLGECADFGCADVRIEEAGPAAIPLLRGVQGCVMEDADVQMSDAKMDERAIVILRHSKDDEREGPCHAEIQTEESPGVILSLSKDEEREGPRHTEIQTEELPGVILSLSKDDECEGPRHAAIQTEECAPDAGRCADFGCADVQMSDVQMEECIPDPPHLESIEEVVRKNLEHPLMPRRPDHVLRSKGYRDLVKQYHMELAMLRGERP